MTATADAAAPAPRRRPSIGFALRFSLFGLLLYLALYYPHAPDSAAGRLLVGYLHLLAFLAGGVVRLFEPAVTVSGHLITGRISLAIIVDCAALDAQALFAAAVLAFSAPGRQKLIGLAAGLAVITLANLGRIAILYFAGASWPAAFRFLHEDFFPFAIVLVAGGAFAAWALWVTGRLGGGRAAA